ncbi:MAG: UvrD-helicase domain-containing protein [Bacteroidaceae bacterium]|nr:UvrD-helicase domain-containing protein [Bacteroidaceae bacterium]
MTAEPLTVYKASAGSGKTFTLAVQYIKLLVNATEPGEFSHILGVTFTNKATTEMKDRIIGQLYNIAKGNDDDDDSYFKALRGEIDPSVSNQEIRRRCADALYEILHDYSRFRVQTIDSFFQVILRGLAHELGLMANPQVELGDIDVLSAAVDRIIDRLEDEPVVQECLMALVHERMDENRRWDVRSDIKRFGLAIFNEDYLRLGDDLRLLLGDEEKVRSLHSRFVSQRNEAISGLQDMGNIMQQAMQQSGYAFADVFSNGKDVETFVRRLVGANAKDEITVPPRLQAKIDDPDPMVMLKKSDREKSELWGITDEMHGMLCQAKEMLDKSQWVINSSTIALAHLKELQLLEFIDREVAAINEETSRFNLSKTPILLARMIKGVDAPFVFEKTGTRLHHVMIDEFQDTSRLQWENFKSLLLESFSRGGHNLVVGDVKQSIYRFRGGDWRILGNIEKQLEPKPDIVPLDTNYRSERRVVEFNNDFFDAAAPLLDAAHGERERQVGMDGMFKAAYDHCRQELPDDKPVSGYVRVTLVERGEKCEAAASESFVVDDVKQTVLHLLESGVKVKDITILIRNRSDCKPILDAFALDERMPSIVSSEAFLLDASEAVGLIIDALRVVDDEAKNTVARYHLVQCGIDTEAFAVQLPELRMLPLYQLVERLYSMLPKEVAKGQDAYIFTLLDAVVDFIQRDNGDVHSFVNYWDEKLHAQAIPTSQPDGIRVMTIHQAKGLEFQTVLLPFCSWKMEKFFNDSYIWCLPEGEPYEQLRLIPVDGISRLAPNSAFQRSFVEEHLLANLDELNTLYVALTRACANLFVWAEYSPSKDERKDKTVSSPRDCARLLAMVMPMLGLNSEKLHIENENENDNVDEAKEVNVLDVTTYVSGDDVAASSEEKAKDSRMSPLAKPVFINMYSNDVGVEFVQSNSSQQFLASLDDEADTCDEVLLAQQSQQLQYIETGKLLHSVLQRILTVDDMSRVLDSMEHEGLLVRSLSNGSSVSVQRSYIEGRLRRGFQKPQIADWFSNRWRLFNECTIVSLDENGVSQHRRPDRVMVSQDESLINVVDYKFGGMKPEYKTQVNEYMELLRQIYPSAKVRGYLWLVYSNDVIEVA